MGQTVRSTLTALALGTIVQRGALLGVTVTIGHALGPVGLGRYALALALGTTIAVLTGTGIRNVTSRGAVREPERAGGWLRVAVRLRFGLALLALVPILGALLLFADDPALWVVGALIGLPLAWDQKGLLDAASRTGHEVLMDVGAAVLQLGGTVLLVATGHPDITLLVVVHLLGRVAYAALAERTLRRLPGRSDAPRGSTVLRAAAMPTLTQTWTGLVQTADVWLVRFFGGEAAAGLYALAQRIATTAALPGSWLTRLLQPHNDRAAHADREGSTMAAAVATAATGSRGLRATAYAVVPLAAGGCVVAGPLCALFGSEFAAAAPALRALLAATALLHLGWQHSQILFAHGRVRAWASSMWLGTVAHVGLLAVLTPGQGATGAAIAALLGHALYLGLAHYAALRTVRLALPTAVAPAIVTGALTATGALLATPLGLFAQLALGALGAALGLYWLELRHTWRRLGHGLSNASGFGGE